jgi:hypothetical protein
MKRLVLLVEGDYDGEPICNIVSRVIGERCPNAAGSVFVDGKTLRVGEIPKLSGRNQPQWLRVLNIARQRRDVGGILTVLDGDAGAFEGRPFCAASVARTLADRAKHAGAGVNYSLAVVVLCQEFESLLIAAAHQLPGFNGQALPGNIEAAPRSAKGWLRKNLAGGYKEQADQLRLTQAVTDWTPVRDQMRCFQRLENAVVQLVQAVDSGRHVTTPVPPSPPTATS